MDERESAVYDCWQELTSQLEVADHTWARAVDHLVEQGVVDLLALLGYYDDVSVGWQVGRRLDETQWLGHG